MPFKKANISKCSSLSPQRFGFKISLPKLNSLSTTALDGRVVLYSNCKLTLIASTRTAVAYSALNPPNVFNHQKARLESYHCLHFNQQPHVLSSEHSEENMDKRLWLIRHATVRPVLPV